MSATTYYVFKLEPGNSPADPVRWREVESVDADNAKQAISKVAQASGEYVAIPKRSFHPVTVEVETTPRVKIVS